ncbi:MAG: MoaD/ThiS family protein [Desulfatitalea sp.]|nr:MoaD/ThiS family protein [Desulfatitalea sp.]
MPSNPTTIDLRLFATLACRTPDDAAHYPVVPGTPVETLLHQLQIPLAEAKLIFINGIKGDLQTRLHGGERVGIFPPVGGG